MIPTALLLIVALLAFVSVLFLFAKRPMYEIMALSLVAIVAATGQWHAFTDYLLFPAQSTLFFTIFAFLVLAEVFDSTNAVAKIVKILLPIIGRLPGGAGYVALVSSTFMATLSGSGPGNVAAVGVFTIPLMKRTGFSPHLAATTEMSAGMLGNIIPPAGIIFLSFGIYDAFAPNSITIGSWLLASYAIGGWFILQRILTLAALCKIYRMQPIPKAELPDLKVALKEGWHALLLPVFILVPILSSALFKDFLILRLGVEGEKAFSAAALMFTPGIAAAYTLFISRHNTDASRLTLANLSHYLGKALSKIVPVAATIYFAYALSQAFLGMGANDEIQAWFVSLNLNTTALAIILPLFFCLLGMILPGSAQIAILGSAMIGAVAAIGGEAKLLALLLPAMTGALEGMTPPLALGLFIAMGIAGSDFLKTVQLALVWIALHLLTSMLLLAGLLPIYLA